MSYDNKGYSSAFKATMIFGGVEMFTLLIAVARNKFSALWIGADGLGIMSLYSSLIYLIYTICNLGLQNSSVKVVAENKSQGDSITLSKIILALKRWGWLTGLVGIMIMMVLSPLLSRWMFQSSDYVIPIIIISVVVLLQSLYRMNHAFLQGIRQIKSMAFASALGALISFVLVIPVFYFLRKDGIIWSLIITAVVTTIISYYYIGKVKLPKVNISLQETFSLGIPAVKLGIMMAMSSITAYFVQFILRIFISNTGSLSDVGFFQAGWALNGHYLGLVFTAMSKDYFPRISQLSKDNHAMMKAVNEQAEIAILILAPLIALMIVFMPLCLEILYTSEFLCIVEMASLLMVGSMIKAGSWAIGYIFPAKGDGKIFMLNEVSTTVISLPIYMVGYKLFGLLGIGYAFIVNIIIYFIWVVVVCKRKYGIGYSKKFWILFLLLTLSLVAVFLARYFKLSSYLVSLPLSFAVVIFSVNELNKRVGLVYYIKNKFKSK